MADEYTVSVRAEPDAGGSDVDDVLLALADRQRRQILRYLHANDGRVSTDEAAAFLADCSDLTVRRARIALLHRHLPRLAEAGLVVEVSESIVYRGHPLVAAVLDCEAGGVTE